MTINHEFDCDHDFFTLPDAPERSTGWIDGWRVEIEDGEILIAEFFDAEKNELFDCSIIPHTDIDRKIDEIAWDRFGVER